MAGLKYRLAPGAVATAPKHKLPILEDGAQTIADSTFIRDHIEQKYRLDLDRGLTADMRARGWAIERMLEDHLYWAIVNLRWADDANFEKGPAHFFDKAPPPRAARGSAAARAGHALRPRARPPFAGGDRRSGRAQHHGVRRTAGPQALSVRAGALRRRRHRPLR